MAHGQMDNYPSKTPKAESVHLSVSRKEMSIFIFKLQCLIPLKEITYILFLFRPPTAPHTDYTRHVVCSTSPR